MENVLGIFEGGLHLAFIGFVKEGIILFIFSGEDEVFPAVICCSSIDPGGKKLYRRNPE
jgi:hypothetical protein